MKITHVAAVALLLAGTAYAQQPQHEPTPPVPPGARHVPDHIAPVPDTVSPQMQAIIAQPYNPNWNVVPKNPAEWKVIVDKAADAVVATLPEIRQALGVTVQPTTIAGVKAFMVTPKVIRPTIAAACWFTCMAAVTCLPGRGRNARSDPDGGLRQVQGDLDRLPHAAGFSVSGCDGRRDGGVEGGRKDERPEEDGDIRDLHRRRDDARDGAARQDGGSAASRRHRARHPMVGHDQDRRHLLHQRKGRQHPGEQ